MVFKRLLFYSVILCHATPAIAQTGSWTVLNGKGSLNDKWSVFVEAQTRSWKFYDDFFYYEVKSALSYNVNKNFSITAGVGTYNTYQTNGNFKKPASNHEIRSWLQVGIQDRFGLLNIDHRYRIEQRHTSSGYRNRFRYRLNTIIPLNHKILTDHTIFLSVFDELFFTNKRPYFERNRLFGGAGYRVNKSLTLQAGYLDQFDYNLTRSLNKGYVQVSVLAATDFKRSKPVKEGRHETID